MPVPSPEEIAAAQAIPAMIGEAEPDYELMADAMYKSEGGKGYNYGIKSVKFKDEAEARRIAINTARNNFKRWQDAGGKWDGRPSEGKVGEPIPYYVYLARKYTPPSADPTGHKNWKVNVPTIYSQLLAQREQPQITLMPTNYVRTVMPNYKL